MNDKPEFEVTPEDFNRVTFALAFKSKSNPSIDEIIEDIGKLRRKVAQVKRSGVSMWNYKEVLPTVFSIIDGSFEVIEELAKKLKEKEDE